MVEGLTNILKTVSPDAGSSLSLIYSPNIAENFVEFCCVFCKSDHLTCNKILVSR